MVGKGGSIYEDGAQLSLGKSMSETVIPETEAQEKALCVHRKTRKGTIFFFNKRF